MEYIKSGYGNEEILHLLKEFYNKRRKVIEKFEFSGNEFSEFLLI